MISLAGRDSRGFSLFELVLVLMLLGVSMAIVLPNIEKGVQDREVRRAALGLAATARDLRSRALLGGVPQQLVLDFSENRYQAAPAVAIHLPAEVTFVSIDGGENLDQDQKRFYFFPNGSSMGGTIVLANSAKSISYFIRLEALTGRVAVSHGDNS